MRKLFFAVILAVLTLAVFSSVRAGNLVWRDPISLADTGLAAEAGTVSLKSLWQPHFGERFAPVPATVWQVYVKLLSPSSSSLPTALHSLSLFVHAANAVLIFLLLVMIVESEWAAFWGAALFAVHPIQVESVAYLSAFSFLIGGFFSLLAMYQFLRQVTTLRSGYNRSKGRRYYWLGTIAMVLAALSQPIYVVTPVVTTILIKLLPKQKTLYAAKPSPWRLGLWWLLVLPQIVVEVMSQHTTGLSDKLPIWSRPVVAGDTVAFYLGKFLLPIGIGPDYGRSPFLVTSHWWSYLMWMIPVILYLLSLPRRGSTQSWYQLALMVFLSLILPVSGLVYFAAQGHSTVSNRYAYLALLGPVIALAYLITKAKRALPVLITLLAVGLSAWLSHRDIKFWQSDESLWPHALVVNPGSPIAHQMLGNKAYQDGDWTAAREHYRAVLAANVLDASVYSNLAQIEHQHGNPEDAAQYYASALQLNPKLSGVHRLLGEVFLAMDVGDKALEHLRSAVAENPDDLESSRQLGILYARRQQFDLAIPYLTKVVETGAKNTQTAEARALLGKALFSTNQPDLALGHLRQVLEIFPNHEEANQQLGDIYYARGLLNDAKVCYERALTHGQGSFEVFEHLGQIHAGRKEYAKAMNYFGSALALKKTDAETLKNLGVAHFHQRQYKEATLNFNKALAINSELSEPYYFLGDLARWQGRDAEAIRNYLLAIKINPAYVDAYYRLGGLYLKKGQHSEAMAQFQAGLKNAPNDPKLTYALRQATQPKGHEQAEM